MTPPRILIITDRQELLLALQQAFSQECACAISSAGSRENALQCFTPVPHDLVLLDIRACGSDPLRFLQEIRQKKEDPTLLVFVRSPDELPTDPPLTEAYDTLSVSTSLPVLRQAIRRAVERCLLLRAKKRLSEECHCHKIFSRIAGNSRAMKGVLDAISMNARGKEPLLITGESGTGKELAARTLHHMSERRQGPFVRVHCPSIDESLLEEEIFGYPESHGMSLPPDKKGFLAAAQGGTLFLDEIGDLAPGIQKKLLACLAAAQTAAGSDSPASGVRILTSTRRNLKRRVDEQLFNKDLYQILVRRNIHLPPLRERTEDIAPLAQALLEKNCHKLKKSDKHIAPDLMKRLTAHPWEGNIRELENTLIQGILFSNTAEIGPDDVHLSGPKPLGPCSAALNEANYKDAKEEALKGFNHVYIARLLKRHRGNVSRAARACGLERQALQQIMKRYDISPAPYRPQTGCDGGYPE